ncbi:MAG: SoxR reducing system RseC family protein, partial [Oscillospiraceae bacterium]|nr:SoxR reducing system RseC family protein [Oscillospiraceae bacterium]
MTQTAVVREVLPGGLAAVEVRRTSACGEACGACGLCGEAPPMRVTARNLLGAAAGDLVTLSTDGRRVLGLASVVYLLPLLFFFAGYAVGVAWRL